MEGTEDLVKNNLGRKVGASAHGLTSMENRRKGTETKTEFRHFIWEGEAVEGDERVKRVFKMEYITCFLWDGVG